MPSQYIVYMAVCYSNMWFHAKPRYCLYGSMLVKHVIPCQAKILFIWQYVIQTCDSMPKSSNCVYGSMLKFHAIPSCLYGSMLFKHVIPCNPKLFICKYVIQSHSMLCQAVHMVVWYSNMSSHVIPSWCLYSNCHVNTCCCCCLWSIYGLFHVSYWSLWDLYTRVNWGLTVMVNVTIIYIPVFIMVLAVILKLESCAA